MTYKVERRCRKKTHFGTSIAREASNAGLALTLAAGDVARPTRRANRVAVTGYANRRIDAQ